MLACAVVLAFAPSAPAAAQSGATAAIAGTVTDSAGAPVPGAEIVLRDDATGAVFTAIADAQGRFYLGGVRPGGPYDLTVTRLGTATLVRRGVRLLVGETLRLPLTLTPRPVPVPGVDVTVERDPAFRASRVGTATYLDAGELDRLPTLRRDVLEFAALSPLVRTVGGGISVAGQNERYNAIRVDGALLQDVFGLSTAGTPGGEANAKALPLGAVEQYRVQVAPYDLRQSGFTGGLLDVVTRSGTNRWQGSAFGYVRDDRMLGDITVHGVPLGFDDYRRSLGGVSIGGPLVADRAHVFLAAEAERRRTPTAGVNLGHGDAALARLAVDSVEAMKAILRDAYDMEPGDYGRIALENPIDNVFARVDLQLGGGDRLVLRHNYARALHEATPNREPFDEYEFSSAGIRRSSRTHSTMLQWVSTPGRGIANELLLNVHRMRASSRPRSDGPLVEVDIISQFDHGRLARRARAGGALFAHRNELDQDVVQIRDDLTLNRGDHRITVGAEASHMGIRHLLLPGARGRYVFGSLAALRANVPFLYERNIVRPGIDDPATRFSLVQLGAYAQDEWSPRADLMIRFGLRVDAPRLPDRPAENATLREGLGISTSAAPAGDVLFSPRIGFNWRPGAAGSTQIRGGAGIFTGRPPLVWIGNAFANTGARTAFVSCIGENAPALDADRPPDACVDGTRATSSAPAVNYLDPDFRFPQDLRASFGIDRRLPFGFAVTLEGVITHALRQIALEDVNLADAVLEPLPEDGYTSYGFGVREHYGEPTVTGFAPRRRDPRFAQVIRIGNGDGNFSYVVSGELRRSFGERLALRASYAYGRSADTQSLTLPDMTANFGLTPTRGNPNTPTIRPSAFDQPHKVAVSAAGTLPERWGGAELTVLYVGQSGRPYSYVYAGDVNGDGYSGGGLAVDAHNDLLFVPGSLSQVPSPSVVTAILMRSAVQVDPCLARFEGLIMHRNVCRTPWSNELDLRVRRPFRIGGVELDLIADAANLLNLLNEDWGRVQRTAPVVPLLRLYGRYEDDSEFMDPFPEADDPLTVRYDGAVQRDPETGGIFAALPYTLAVPASQWQMQLGLRVRF